jgi:tetratricopeptide (TPR) repeat protein
MANNQQSLEELAWAIEMAQGQFTPILAHCNYARLREKMVQKLREICSVKIPEITLEPTTTQLYSIIRKFQAEAEGEIPGIQVIGLDSIKDIDRLLQEINPVREEFRKNCPFAVVLWVSDRIIQRLVRVISDFESWTTRIEFSLSDEELLEEIRQKTETLFTAVLQIGDVEFVPNQVILGSQYLLELESAVIDLKGDRQELPPELSASLKFVQGRDAYIKDEIQKAISDYQESLGFWQESDHQEKQGIILFHLGLCSQRQAELNRHDKQQYLQAALSYYQQSIDIFERAKRPDLVAQFIGQTGDMLRRLKDWDNLAKLAKKSQQLHTQYGSPVQLARDYGFLAEVALNQHKFAEAKKLAEQAIYILNHPENIQKTSDLCRGELFAKTIYCSPHVQDKITSGSGLDSASALSTNNFSSHLTTPYLLLLARSLRGMGQVKEAIKTLKKAKKTNPEYYPNLYIDILEELRSIYFEHKKYLRAFKLKREQRSLQQQFRLTAFIGAGRLQSQRYTKVVQMIAENSENVAEEIVASGREKDLQQLWQRLSSTYSKLIVIHGQSGVGKSSLVNAGLIPSLKLKSIGTKNCLPVTLRVYTNWQAELGKKLADALADRQIILPETPDTLGKIISYLDGKQSENLLTVFIFDQFEEFFFVCQKTAQQQEFFQFLADGLKLPGVKVILSLRTDYLHYLLIGNKLESLDIINNDILGKNVLYAIDNFSAADAAEIIKRLTGRSQFQLEPELIAEMVKDLAGSRDELYPSVRPIELQVVGAQMQAENITTLAEYRAKGPKDKLVERYLAAVVQDCGEENKQMAELVLYFLADQDKRPLKTLTELTAELKINFADVNGVINGDRAFVDKLGRQLKLILDIFVKSGLVFEVSDIAIKRYQLVHDYLVDLIHQQIGDEVAELKKEREKRKQAEARFARLAIFGGLAMTCLAVALGFFGVDKWKQAIKDKLEEETVLQEQASFAKELGEFAPVKALTYAIALQPKIKQNISKEVLEIVKPVLPQILQEARERNLLKGHTQRVSAVTITPDGKKIVSVSDDQTIRVWDFAGNELIKLTADDGKILSVAIAPDGEKIVSGSENGMIRVWDFDGNKLKEFKGHNAEVLSLAITPDGQKIVSGSYDKTIRVWDFQGEQLQEIKHDRGINVVAIAPNGSTIVFGGWDYKIYTWDFQSKELKKLGEHQAVVTSLAITPDGKKIVSGSYDNTIRVWDFDGKELAILTEHENAVSSVAIAPDGKTIISGSFDKTIRLWDFEGKQLAVLKGHEYYINSVAVTPDGSKIVSASGDKTIRVWDIDSVKLESHVKKNRETNLQIACERLQLHPVFVEAEASANKKAFYALEVCKKKVWNKTQNAEFLIQHGLRIARLTGDLNEAQNNFDEARNLDPKFYDSLKYKPEEKAKSLAALFWIDEGEKLAKAGKIPEAIAKFKQAKNLDNLLDFDPETRASELASDN